MNRRLKRGTPFAAYAALIFNAALCVAPFIGARAVSIAYGDDRPQYEASPAALAATLVAHSRPILRPPRQVETLSQSEDYFLDRGAKDT